MKVQIGGIEDCDMVNGGHKNVAHTIFFAGCIRDCKGCHNKELQPLNSGSAVMLSVINDGITENKLATCVVLTGGEPILQYPAAYHIALHAHRLGKEVWLYTSYELEDIPNGILDFVDVIKTGWYDEDLKTTDGVLATSNQHYYRKEANLWKLT